MRIRPFCLAWLVGTIVAARVLATEDLPTLTEKNVITGTMTIRFDVPAPTTQPATLPTLVPSLSPSTAAARVDVCDLRIEVAKTTAFMGTIVRSSDRFTFNVDVGVANPKNLLQKKTVGRWTGDVPRSADANVFDLSSLKQNALSLRITIDAIGKAQASSDPFAGILRASSSADEPLPSRHYVRIVDGIQVKLDADPTRTLSFQNVDLAKGPAAIYPRTTVNGRVDYDARTAALIVDRLAFTSSAGNARHTDTVTGTIHWTSDPHYATNGRGAYAVNLCFNALTRAAQPTTRLAPTTRPDFFTTDPDSAALVGTITSIDTFDSARIHVRSRSLGFQINANQLTKPQILGVFKAGLLGMMPVLGDRQEDK